jgi:hypothetical protein
MTEEEATLHTKKEHGHRQESGRNGQADHRNIHIKTADEAGKVPARLTRATLEGIKAKLIHRVFMYILVCQK